MAKTTITYQPQWYQSDESRITAWAVTPEEHLWITSMPQMESQSEALDYCRSWDVEGSYRASRIVEYTDGLPTSVVWMSVWESPLTTTTTEEAGAGSGLPGETIKLLVWMDRDQPLDHWNFQNKLKGLRSNNNWDLVYARPIDTKGRMVQYSVRLNLWPVGKKPVDEWNWWTIFDKDPETQADEVEVVRSNPIPPREFPSGVDTVDCTNCGKTVEAAKQWRGWDDEQDMMVPFCSCRCIDEMHDTDRYRQDPDGDEHEDPGCVCLVTSAA